MRIPQQFAGFSLKIIPSAPRAKIIRFALANCQPHRVLIKSGVRLVADSRHKSGQRGTNSPRQPNVLIQSKMAFPISSGESS